MQGEERHDRRGEDYPVVMVEVETPVDQLDVAETDREKTSRHPIAVSQGDAERGQADHEEVNLHPWLGPGPDPFESGVREVIGRLDEQGLDPPSSKEPDDEDHADDAEPGAEKGT